MFECVRKAPFLVALPPEHPLAKKRRLRLSELANEKFISIRQTAPAYHSSFVGYCRCAAFMPEIAREEADRTLSMLGLVPAGFGVALVPETFQQILPVEVEFRPLRPSIPTFNFHIAWRRDNQSSVLHAFLEMLRKHAHAEAKGPEKTAVARDSDRYLHRRSQRKVGAAKKGRKDNYEWTLRCFWKPRLGSVRTLCCSARTGSEPFSRIPLKAGEGGRKRDKQKSPER